MKYLTDKWQQMRNAVHDLLHPEEVRQRYRTVNVRRITRLTQELACQLSSEFEVQSISVDPLGNDGLGSSGKITCKDFQLTVEYDDTDLDCMLWRGRHNDRHSCKVPAALDKPVAYLEAVYVALVFTRKCSGTAMEFEMYYGGREFRGHLNAHPARSRAR